MQSGLGLIGGLCIFIYLVMMLGMFTGYVIIIIAIWRGMKAHESIAETFKNYLKFQRSSSLSDKQGNN